MYIIPNFLVLHFGENFMKIQTKIPKLQMHENLHKNVLSWKFAKKMWMKTCFHSHSCFHSHFYTNFHASVTLLFLFGLSWNFHQNVELRKLGMIYTILGSFCSFFELGRGPIFGPIIRPRKISERVNFLTCMAASTSQSSGCNSLISSST